MKRLFLFIICAIIIWNWMDVNPFHVINVMKKGGRDLTDRIQNADISIGYVLKKDQWTRFSIHQQNEGIKVLTNANIDRQLSYDPEKQFWYAVRYQVLDKDMNILADRQYVHRTRLTQYQNVNNEPILTQFYLDQNIIPMDTRIMRIHLSEISSTPHLIRFSLAWKDEDVADVILRAYIKEKTSDLKKGHLWHRFSEERKESLVKGNVFPHDLLRDKEREYLLEAIYRPMGPRGIEGQSYHVRELYVADDIEGKSDISMDIPPGLYIDQYHHGIIPLPMEGGRVVLEFDGEFARSPDKNHQVLLRWFGPRPEDRASSIIRWQGDKKYFIDLYKGGMIELRSSKPLVVRVYLDEKKLETEITPDPIYVRAFKINAENPITYDIHHTKQTPTPFRVDFRYLHPIEEPLVEKPINISYELLNEKEEVIQKSSFTLSQPINYYDRIQGQTGSFNISDPLSKYFRLTPFVKKVRFYSDAPVFINAYDRPFGLIKQTRVPEDYFKFHLKEDDRQLTWFEVQPPQVKQLAVNHRMIFFKLQYRPPEDKTEILSGRYEWQAFYPENLWHGRYLFAPFETEIIRDEQINAVYRWIPADKDLQVAFQQPVKGLHQVAPTLLFLRKSAETGIFEIFINGKSYVRQSIRGARGEIAIPELPSGTYHLKISSPPNTTAFINYTGSTSASYFKRFAVRFDHKGLKFKYRKTTWEEDVLSVRYFKPVNHKAASVITAKIDYLPSASRIPYNDYTLQNRRFILQQGETNPPVAVLNTRDEYVDQGRLFYISLGQDTPPGDYVLDFSLDQGPPGYVIFSKTTLGIMEKREFYKERGGANDIHY